MALDPNRFTSLGPKPLQSNGCINCFSYGLVSGRTNVIAIDPVTPNVAYLGSNGGGVWKTTNCCSASTTWTPVTDDPLLSTIAIGDIVIDPNDHNVVYAGTGDLRFGSFSFGSAGLLKSSDQGATWRVLGADVFNPIYLSRAASSRSTRPSARCRLIPTTAAGCRRRQNRLVPLLRRRRHVDRPCLTNGFTTQRQDITGLLLRDTGAETQVYAFIGGARGFATTVQLDLDQNGANGVYRALLPASGCPTGWETLSRDRQRLASRHCRGHADQHRHRQRQQSSADRTRPSRPATPT